MQQKSVIELYWPQIEEFKRQRELTWSEVADKIGVTVAMLMMVKSGKRRLSKKSLERFKQAEREAPSPKPQRGTMILVLSPLRACQRSIMDLCVGDEKGA